MEWISDEGYGSSRAVMKVEKNKIKHLLQRGGGGRVKQSIGVGKTAKTLILNRVYKLNTEKILL